MNLFKLSLAIIAISGSFSTQANEVRIVGMDNPSRIKDSYIVVFKSNLQSRSIDLAETIAINNGGNVERKYSKVLNGFSLRIPDSAITAIANNPNIAFIEADSIHTTQTVSSWGLDRIDQRNLPLDNSFTTAATGLGVHAYIIDSGIRATHNEFTGRLGNGTDLTGEPLNCNNHGTHVAGTLGGSTYGVAADVILHDIRIRLSNTRTIVDSNHFSCG